MPDPTPTPRVDLEELVAEGRRLLVKDERWVNDKRGDDEWATSIFDADGGALVASCSYDDAALIVWLRNHAPDLLEAVEYAGRCEKALREARNSIDLARHSAMCAVTGGYDYPCNCWKRDAMDAIGAALARPHPDEEAAADIDPDLLDNTEPPENDGTDWGDN